MDALVESIEMKETKIEISTHDKHNQNDPYKLLNQKIPHSKIKDLRRGSHRSKRLASFYKNQNEIIDDLLRPADFVRENEEERLLKLKIAVYGSFAANIALFALQLVAAISSDSMSLFATMADAFMDLASSSVLVFAGYFANKASRLTYPTGKKRLETAGIIVFSVLMATLALQLIVEAVKKLIAENTTVNTKLISLICVGIAVLVKGCLFLYCNALREYPAARVFAQDHRNDIILNIFGITLSVLGSKVKWWLDPLGGILIALLIMRSWSGTAYEHIRLIVGASADPVFLQRITYITITHDPRIQQIDTARAYHAGDRFFVEVDIVLPQDMTLKEAHDIGESLQFKLESLPNVERAFVHLDYETEHAPEH